MATPQAIKQETAPQTGAMARHPIETMAVCINTYGFTGRPIVKIGISGEKAAKAFDAINFALERAQFLILSSMKVFSLENDEEIKKHFERTKLDLVKTSLSDEFAKKYEDEIDTIETAENLIILLKNIIGEISEAQIIEQARKKLQNITRSSDENETFTRFLARIVQLATQISQTEAIQEYLTKDAFERNLTPNNKQFLLESEKTNETIQNKAAYLDKMKKNKRNPHINEIDSKKSTAFEEEMLKQLTALTSKIDEMRTQNSAQECEIFKLKTEIKKGGNQQTKIPEKGVTKFPENQPRYINPSWELNKYGKPYRCRRCGILGHKDENCRGTTLQCRNCNKVGHIAPACKQIAKN